MKIKSYILWLLLFLFSCQKDFYLDDLNEAQAEIERITAQKKRVGDKGDLTYSAKRFNS